MSDAPKITFEGFANAVCLKADNADGRECVISRAESFKGNYTEHDVVTGNFSELVDPAKTYKYGCAFLENAQIGRRSKGAIRNYVRDPADPPSQSGSFAVSDVATSPPSATGSFDVTLL